MNLNRPYRCDICKRRYTLRQTANEHVQAVHHVDAAYASMLVTVRKRLRWTR